MDRIRGEGTSKLTVYPRAKLKLQSWLILTNKLGNAGRRQDEPPKKKERKKKVSQLVYLLLNKTTLSLLQEVSESPAPPSKSEWHGQVLARPAITFCLLHRPCSSGIGFSSVETKKEGW